MFACGGMFEATGGRTAVLAICEDAGRLLIRPSTKDLATSPGEGHRVLDAAAAGGDGGGTGRKRK